MARITNGEPTARPIGDLLREWRQRRRMSQLDLACEAEVSTKHLSFLETGRAPPGRALLLRIAERLTIPLRDRNAMLDAAGLDHDFRERALDDPEFRLTRQCIDLILAMHEPNPALAVGRHWTIAASNRAVGWLIAGADPLLLTPPVNFVRLCLHPAGLAPRIINLGDWRRHLLTRLRQQIDATGDPALRRLAEEIGDYPLPQGEAGRVAQPDQDAVAVPLRLATIQGPLSFFSTTTVFGGPVDITLAELTIESFFPADAATTAVMRQMEAKPAPAAVPRVTRRMAARAASG